MSETPAVLGTHARIMHILTDSSSALAEVAVLAIKAQLAAGYKVAVAARASVFEALNLSGEQLRHIEIGAGAGLRPGDPASAFTLHKYYRHIDIVHAHGQHAAALAGAGLTGLPSSMHPTIIASIGRTNTDGMFAQAEQQLIAKTATVVLGTTEPIVEDYRELVPIAERAQLLRSDADAELTPVKTAKEIRTQFGIPDGAWLIAVPAALIDSPALTTIVEALSRIQLARADRRWNVIFTGGGRSRELIEKEFVARFDHLRSAPEYLTVDVISAADLVIATDRMSVVNAEQLMQLARPIVFTGSERGARVYGDTAPTLAEGDTAGLIHAIERLVDHPAERAVAGIRLRQRVTASQADFIADDLLALYQEAHTARAQ